MALPGQHKQAVEGTENRHVGKATRSWWSARVVVVEPAADDAATLQIASLNGPKAPRTPERLCTPQCRQPAQPDKRAL
jgi:hypothetical protein